MSARRQGYREPPPRAHERVAWPTGFGSRFTVFVDVEEEFDWSGPFDAGQRATRAMAAFPAAHRRFAERGVAPICLVDHPIATDPRSIAILHAALADGRTAIGAQLHPWVNPPFDPAAEQGESYAGNLPRALEAAKIDRLGEAIAAAWGASPTIYRAGRYGIGADTRALLAARGYRFEASVRARYDYAASGGPDFGAVGSEAYRRDGLIELPATTIFTGAARTIGPRLYRAAARVPHAPGVLARSGLLSRVALTPEGMPIAEALAALDVAVREGQRWFSLSFHSPSLEPGHTPYVRDAADLRRFWTWWDRMLDRLAARGIANASLAEIAAALPDG